jgi:hypothetical protein
MSHLGQWAGNNGKSDVMKNVFGNIRPLLVVYLLSATGICQSRIEVGLRGGIPFNEAFQSQINSPYTILSSDRPRYSVGPMLRARVAEHLAVQLDVLYTHSRWDSKDAVPGYYGDVLTHSAHYNRWDFPVLATLATNGRRAVFIGGGIALHRSGGTLRVTHFSPTGAVDHYSGNTFGDDGKAVSIVVTSGLRWRIRAWSLEPEIRYSRFRSDLLDSYGHRFDVIRTPNQFEFMAGVMLPQFRSRNDSVN